MKHDPNADIGTEGPSPGMYAAAAGLAATIPLNVHTVLGPPIAGDVLFYFAAPVLDLSDAAALAVVAVAVSRSWRGSSEGTSRPLFFVGGVVAFAALALLFAPLSIEPPLSSFQALHWGLSAALGWALVRHGPSFGWWARALSLAMAPQALIAIAQTVLQRPLGLPAEVNIPAGMPGSLTMILPDGMLWLRGSGLTFHCNVLGGLLAVSLILSLHAADRRWVRAVWYLQLIALVCTLSRSAWIAVAMALPLSWVLLRVRRPRLRPGLHRIAVGAALCLAAASLLLAHPIIARLAPIGAAIRQPVRTVRQPDQSPERERIVLMRIALEIARERPFTGIGAGSFPLELQHRRAPTEFHPVHNIPLLLAAEIGVIGGILWLFGALAALWLTMRRWRTLPSAALLGLAAWLAIVAIGMFDHYVWAIVPGRTLTVIVLALVDRNLAGPSTA
jgi:O-antigen ligase